MCWPNEFHCLAYDSGNGLFEWKCTLTGFGSAMNAEFLMVYYLHTHGSRTSRHAVRQCTQSVSLRPSSQCWAALLSKHLSVKPGRSNRCDAHKHELQCVWKKNRLCMTHAGQLEDKAVWNTHSIAISVMQWHGVACPIRGSLLHRCELHDIVVVVNKNDVLKRCFENGVITIITFGKHAAS